MKKRQVLIFLFMLIVGFIFVWTSAFSGDVEPEGLLVFNENLSTESYAVYSNGSHNRLVISGDYDKYRLENGSLAKADYNINNFKVEKSRFVVELGSKTPSVNFTFKSNSLKFKFVGWGIYDPVDDDFWLSQEYNDIIPVVDGNKIFYDQIVENISVSYEINRTGANKLITFTQKSRDSLPPAFSNSSFIFFAERIEGDLPKVNSSWGKMLFEDVFIPEYPDVFKKIFHYQGNDYLLTAIHFSFYNSSEFPFSIDPTLKPLGGGCSSTPCIFGSWGDLNGDTYTDVVIEDSATVYVGADNCSQTDASPALESDCTWYVNVSGFFYLEEGSSINGVGRGRFGSDTNYVDGVGAGGDGVGDRAGGGGAGAYGDGGDGSVGTGGTAGSYGSGYNDTDVPVKLLDGYPSWAGSGGGASGTGESGGDGGAGIYVEAFNISIDGSIVMDGDDGMEQDEAFKAAGGGGSAGSIILRALDTLGLGYNSGNAVLSCKGGDGGDNNAHCDIPNDCYTGGGAGGGWVELHYANLINLSSVSVSVINGTEGQCPGSAPAQCKRGKTGVIGSISNNFQFNAAPNFTDGYPTFSESPGIGGDIVLQVNVSSQSPLNVSDYVVECNFSVWKGTDYFINNTNASVAEDFMFNYTYTTTVSGVHNWNVTCYDSGGFTTLDDGRGTSTFSVDDMVSPSIDILSHAEGETVDVVGCSNVSNNVLVYTHVYDEGGIFKVEYSLDKVSNTSVSCVGTTTDCYVSPILSLGSEGTTTDYTVWFFAHDKNGTSPPSSSNYNETNVNISVTVPSCPVTPPAGGGGGALPPMVVVPYCGDGECQAEAGENIFTCRLDCATLSRLTTGELLKEGLVTQYIIYLLIILAGLSAIEAVTYQKIGGYFRRKWGLLKKLAS